LPEEAPRDPSPLPAAGARPPLPVAERRRRVREFWMGVVLIAAVSGLLLLPSISGLTQGVGDSGLFLFLNAFTVILILILGLIVTRNF
jgi:hypothetical protein